MLGTTHVIEEKRKRETPIPQYKSPYNDEWYRTHEREDRGYRKAKKTKKNEMKEEEKVSRSYERITARWRGVKQVYAPVLRFFDSP